MRSLATQLYEFFLMSALLIGPAFGLLGLFVMIWTGSEYDVRVGFQMMSAGGLAFGVGLLCMRFAPPAE